MYIHTYIHTYMNVYTHICIYTYIFLCKLDYMFLDVRKCVLFTLYHQTPDAQ